jgi:heat shock protein HtpX
MFPNSGLTPILDIARRKVKMYNAIARNKRNTVIIISLFVAFFTAVSAWLSWITNNIWVGVSLLAFICIFTIVQYFAAARWAIGLAGGVRIDKDTHPRLWRTVENLAISEGMPMPKVYIIPDDSINAMAIGRDPAHAHVGATEGLLKITEKYELEGVMAHEMAHIKNYDTRVKLIVFGLVGAFSALAQFCWLFIFGIFGSSRGGQQKQRGLFLTVLLFPLGFVLFFVGIIAWLISTIIGPLVMNGVSRQREYLADATGALMTRHPEALMSALNKMELFSQAAVRKNKATAGMYFTNPFRRGLFSRLLSSHPPTDDRIDRLAEMAQDFF